MKAKEDKTAAALVALEDIRSRIKPHQDFPDTPIIEETSEEESKGVRIIDNVERGLVQILFPNMPPDKVHRYLKKHEFTWKPGERCWQTERSEKAGYYAKEVVDRLEG